MKIEFGDGSHMLLKKLENGVKITLQAKHLGDNFKITSISAVLNEDEVKNIIEWIGEKK